MLGIKPSAWIQLSIVCVAKPKSVLTKFFTTVPTDTIMSSWNRLIRFVDDKGAETFGEPCIQNDQELTDNLAKDDLWAVELKGSSPVGALTRGEKVHVKALREILRPNDVPIVRCIGLNYIKHSKFILRWLYFESNYAYMFV